MFANFADFLLGAGLARRAPVSRGPRRSPSLFRATETARGWHARVGTY